MSNFIFYLALTAAIAVSAFTGRISAGWSDDPAINVRVCTAPMGQGDPMAVSDGTGGAIVIWTDFRDQTCGQGGDENSIFGVQHVDNAGNVLWPADGVIVQSVCGLEDLQAVPDADGGVIMVWTERDSLNLSMQHIDAFGNLMMNNPPQLTSMPTHKQSPVLAPDGYGGAIVAWVDYRNPDLHDVYAQRVNGNGGGMWAVDGIPVFCGQTNDIVSDVECFPDGQGGVIILWVVFHRHGGEGSWVFGQRFNAAGSPLWDDNGKLILPAPITSVIQFAATSDHGVALTWVTGSGDSGATRFAQKIDSSGAFVWPGASIFLPGFSDWCDSSLSLNSDDCGGLLLSWISYPYIMAQHIGATGEIMWDEPCALPPSDAQLEYTYSFPAISTDSAGGAIIFWQERICTARFNCHSSLKSQRLGSDGLRQWQDDGVTVYSNTVQWRAPSTRNVVSDQACGAMVFWGDWRDRTPTFLGTHIYGQRVFYNGQLGNHSGANIWIPKHHFSAGDAFFFSITVANDSTTTLLDYPLFVILNVGDSFYFGPGFTESLDCYRHPYPPGETNVSIVPEFAWPEGASSLMSGSVWYAALTDPQVATIVGDPGIFEFR